MVEQTQSEAQPLNKVNPPLNVTMGQSKGAGAVDALMSPANNES